MKNKFDDYNASYITPQYTLLKKLNKIIEFLHLNPTYNVFAYTEDIRDSLSSSYDTTLVQTGEDRKLYVGDWVIGENKVAGLVSQIDEENDTFHCNMVIHLEYALKVDDLKALIVGSDFISVDDGTGQQAGKLVIELDETMLDDEPTEDSENLVKSGGVYDALHSLTADDIIASNTQSVQDNLERIDGNVEDCIDDIADLQEGKLNASKNAIATAGGLVVPSTAPVNDILVGIDTSNGQSNVSIGDGLTLDNGVLSAEAGSTKNLYMHTMMIKDDDTDIIVATFFTINDSEDNWTIEGKRWYSVSGKYQDRFADITPVILYDNDGVYELQDGQEQTIEITLNISELECNSIYSV